MLVGALLKGIMGEDVGLEMRRAYGAVMPLAVEMRRVSPLVVVRLTIGLAMGVETLRAMRVETRRPLGVETRRAMGVATQMAMGVEKAVLLVGQRVADMLVSRTQSEWTASTRPSK